ncbi:MAG: DMT family transporter [Candidatus Portnoybacteria bacterium]|nr:DMT family transporter [Candidatus Portnoybacteria bacterium]
MNKNKGLLLVLGTALISGIVVFISKMGVTIINPYIFTGLKNIIVAFLVVGWLLMLKDWQILKGLKKSQWMLLSGIGLIGGSIPFLLYFKGLSLTAPIQAAFIHKTMFVYVAVLAGIFLKEKISQGFLIGGLLLLLGNILLLRIIPHQFGMGDFLILIATLFWASENVLSKYLLKELPSRIVIWGRMFFGSIFIILFWLMTGQAHLAASLNVQQIGWVLITSVFLFGYLATWYTGLKYLKVSVAATILLLASPITTLLSLLFLGQTLVLSQIIGMILIALAIFWVYKSSRTVPKMTSLKTPF